MNERMVQFRIGVTMVAALLILIILLVLFNREVRVFGGSEDYPVRFPTAPGVAVGTPVRKLGILIGRVEGIDFAPDGQGVIVTTSLDADKPILDSETVRINVGLLGDAVLEIVPSGQGQPVPRSPGAEIQGVTYRDPLQFVNQVISPEGELAQTVASIRQTSDNIGQLAATFNRVVGQVEQQPGQVEDLLTRTGNAIVSIDDAARALAELLGDQTLRDNLRDSSDKIPGTIDAATRALDSIAAAGEEARLALAEARQFTTAISEEGPVLIGDLRTGVDGLNKLVAQVTTLAEKINRPDSPISQFLEDETAYQNIRVALYQVAKITEDLRREVAYAAPKIRHILTNAEEITGKIAQDPATVVRGALRQPNQPISQGGLGVRPRSGPH